MAKLKTAICAVLAAAALGLLAGHFAVLAQQRNLVAPGQGPVKPVVSQYVYDIPRLVQQLQVPKDVFRGRVLWIQRCALCHDGVGQPSYHTIGPWLDASTVKSLGKPAMRAIIAAGGAQMPGFRYDLSAQQVNDLLAFLTTVKSRPTAAELAYKSRFR